MAEPLKQATGGTFVTSAEGIKNIKRSVYSPNSKEAPMTTLERIAKALENHLQPIVMVNQFTPKDHLQKWAKIIAEAALAALPPDGMVCVPREPLEELLKAACTAACDVLDADDCPICPVKKLEAMLTASPTVEDAWTDEVPTVPGWYWWSAGAYGAEVVKVEIRDGLFVYEPDGTAYGIPYKRKYVAEMPGQWSGPIKPPEGGG
jgi:hypothetical protein